MAIGIGNLGNIVQDFTESLNQIFGGATNSNPGKGGGDLFNSTYGGSPTFSAEKWTGNSKTRQVRYGFTLMNLNEIRSRSQPAGQPSSLIDKTAYYLDIPPQSIRQKEIFATNIAATRKGIIVETEGVVFKDIIIQGTTGVFPGERGGANVPGSNLFTDPFSPPSAAAGVDPDTGRSRKSGVKTISGYEEFMRLRQYFLKYAAEKVRSDGNLFLIFINEKDDQALIVEPLEFEMIRDRRSPMTYEYRIVLKAIGNLNTVFEGLTGPGEAEGFLGVLEDIGNLSANISASIQQSRAVINQSTRLLSRFSQALDQTFLDPLRQTQFAMEDLSDGVATVLSLPEILVRNATDSVLSIRESASEIGSSIDNFSVSTTSDQEERLAQTAQFQKEQEVKDSLNNDNKVPLPRTFLEGLRAESRGLSDNMADFTNLGSTDYDTIKGRTPTQQSSPLKQVSDNEFLLMGSLEKTASDMNLALASNGMFAADADVAFERSQALFRNDNIREDQQIVIARPDFVREVTIQRGDILERIAQREYGSADRWLDIVVLNNLKPPYIDETGGDGIKKPGEKLLIGDK